MSKESEELAGQLLNKLWEIKAQVEDLRSTTARIREINSSYRDYVSITSWCYGELMRENLHYSRAQLTDMERIADEADEKLTKLNTSDGVILQLEQAINNLPEVQEMRRRNEVMKETNELEKRELELKKSIASKQVEAVKISKGFRRVFGFSFVLVFSFTTVGILFPYTWVLCVTTIFVGIITLFVALNMLFGLHKDGILDAGTLEKDKVELDWVQTKKAQLFLESNQ